MTLPIRQTIPLLTHVRLLIRLSLPFANLIFAVSGLYRATI